MILRNKKSKKGVRMLGLKNVLMFVAFFQLGTVYAQNLELEKNYTEEVAQEVTDISHSSSQDEFQEGKFFYQIDPEKLSYLEEKYQNEIGDNPIQAAPLKLKCTCGVGACRSVITITYYGRSEEGANKACERACNSLSSNLFENTFIKMEPVPKKLEAN